ncbi:MAG: nucleoside triphosphate pyrophosphohydrolase [Oscillospiraceae bacterium]
MVDFEYQSRYDLEDLIRILRILRGPGGCPWDQVQTHRSNRRNFLEEAYEAAEAFDRDDPRLMCEELGDMLMQVLFNIHIEEDAGRFTMDDVTDGVCKKLIFRHPHVFGDVNAETPEQVLVNWEALKKEEKGIRSAADNLDHVARSLPALWRAEKMQSKAAAAGFDWPDVNAAMDKLEEETGELRRALEGQGDVAEELGDLLFAAVKVGRFAELDPETVLHDACEKFLRRFRRVEQAASETGQALSGLPRGELERLWAEAKRPEAKSE